MDDVVLKRFESPDEVREFSSAGSRSSISAE